MAKLNLHAFLGVSAVALMAIGASQNISAQERNALEAISARTVLVSASEDKAGPWGTFGPGAARITGDTRDWHLALSFRSSKEIEIASITLLHDQIGYPAEGWSTSSDYYYGKGLYPLVVFNAEGNQVNSAYDQSIGRFRAGKHLLHLFAQTENPDFGGGKLIVKLTSGEELSFKVSERKAGQCRANDPAMSSVADELINVSDGLLGVEVSALENQSLAAKLEQTVKKLKRKLRLEKRRK